MTARYGRCTCRGAHCCPYHEERAERRAEGDEERHDVESDRRGTLAERRYERFVYGEGS